MKRVPLRESSDFQSRERWWNPSAYERKDGHHSAYRAALREPTVSLVGKTDGRPDAASAAVLGYD
jgi:hypothetical protein